MELCHRQLCRKLTYSVHDVELLRHSLFGKGHRHSSTPFCKAAASQKTLRRASRPEYDCIFVLGGGLNEDGSLPERVISRLKLGAEILREQGEQCMILCLGGGTPHKPAVAVNGHVLHEAAACADFLLEKGISARRILKETASYDTVGNGYFATTMHAIPARWRHCALVTSNFHLARSRAVFEKCFELANASRFDEAQLCLTSHGADDDHTMSEEVFQARSEKELRSLKEWEAAAAKLHSLQALHSWLHETHLCYSVARQGELFRKQESTESPVLMASY